MLYQSTEPGHLTRAFSNPLARAPNPACLSLACTEGGSWSSLADVLPGKQKHVKIDLGRHQLTRTLSPCATAPVFEPWLEFKCRISIDFVPLGVRLGGRLYIQPSHRACTSTAVGLTADQFLFIRGIIRGRSNTGVYIKLTFTLLVNATGSYHYKSASLIWKLETAHAWSHFWCAFVWIMCPILKWNLSRAL